MTTETANSPATGKSSLAYLLPLIVFAAAILFFAVPLLTGKDPSNLPSAMLGKPAPEFNLPALSPDIPGLRHDMLKGHVSVVNVFASWCAPCKVEHPVLSAFAATHDIPLYGISYKDQPDAALKWLTRAGNPYDAAASDVTGQAMIDWGVYGVPETYVIDADGVIRYRHAGALTQNDIDTQILPRIRELQP